MWQPVVNLVNSLNGIQICNFVTCNLRLPVGMLCQAARKEEELPPLCWCQHHAGLHPQH